MHILFVKNILSSDYQDDLKRNVHIKRFCEECVMGTLHQQLIRNDSLSPHLS